MKPRQVSYLYRCSGRCRGICQRGSNAKICLQCGGSLWRLKTPIRRPVPHPLRVVR